MCDVRAANLIVFGFDQETTVTIPGIDRHRVSALGAQKYDVGTAPTAQRDFVFADHAVTKVLFEFDDQCTPNSAGGASQSSALIIIECAIVTTADQFAAGHLFITPMMQAGVNTHDLRPRRPANIAIASANDNCGSFPNPGMANLTALRFFEKVLITGVVAISVWSVCWRTPSARFMFLRDRNRDCQTNRFTDDPVSYNTFRTGIQLHRTCGPYQ